jgi:hypothetical protein
MPRLLTTLFIVSSVLFSSADSLLFSPYKDVTIGFDWTTNVVSTVALSDAGLDSVTWAFATGVCGSETWAGISGNSIATANVQKWADAGIKYVVSTGGANGAFTCATADALTAFVERYNSDGLIGIDFDVEGGVTQSDVDALVTAAKAVQKNFPKLRFSFTVATTAYALGVHGLMVVDAFKRLGGDGLLVNLMAMDYGSTSNCVAKGGACDMGASAVSAARAFSKAYGVSLDRTEVTVMIGGNDTPDEIFTLADVDTLAAFALESGLAGLHFWSLDRDNDCASGPAKPTCNSYGQAGAFGFSKQFLTALGEPQAPTPRPTKSPSPTPKSPKPTTKSPTTKSPSPTPKSPKPTKSPWRIPTPVGCR